VHLADYLPGTCAALDPPHDFFRLGGGFLPDRLKELFVYITLVLDLHIFALERVVRALGNWDQVDALESARAAPAAGGRDSAVTTLTLPMRQRSHAGRWLFFKLAAG